MAEANIPYVNWPNLPGDYKVIQILKISNRLPYMRLNVSTGPSFYSKNHMETLWAFGKEIGVRLVPKKGNSLVDVLPEGCGYRMVGAGECEVNLENKVCRFEGFSATYNLFIDQEHLKLMKQVIPEWRLFWGETEF